MLKKEAVESYKLRFSLRQGLVVFQFFKAQVFIISLLIVAQQLNYLKTGPMSFDQVAILIIPLKDKNAKHCDFIDSELYVVRIIHQMSFSKLTAISQSMRENSYTIEGQKAEKGVSQQFADCHFTTTHDIRFLAGTTCSSSDSVSGFVVNEAFVKVNGWQHA